MPVVQSDQLASPRSQVTTLAPEAGPVTTCPGTGTYAYITHMPFMGVIGTAVTPTPTIRYTTTSSTTGNVFVASTVTTTSNVFIATNGVGMDTEYILNSAFELADITPLEYVLLCDQEFCYRTVRQMIDHNVMFPEDFLANTVQQWIDVVPREEVYRYALRAIPFIDDSKKFIKDWLRLRVQQKMQSDLAVLPQINTGIVMQLSPRLVVNMPRVVDTEDQVEEGTVRQVLDFIGEGRARRWRRDIVLIAEAQAWLQTPEGRDYFQQEEANVLARIKESPYYVAPRRQINSLRIEQAMQAAVRTLERRQQQAREDIKRKTKASLKRAYKLSERLGRSNDVRMLIAGEEVTITHPDSKFKFVVRCSTGTNWLFNRTTNASYSTPYDLMVLTKDDVYLAKLCVYFKETPVLDQLLGLAIYVNSGEELALLEKANWINNEEWCDEKRNLVLDVYPSLKRKLPIPYVRSTVLRDDSVQCPDMPPVVVPQQPNQAVVVNQGVFTNITVNNCVMVAGTTAQPAPVRYFQDMRSINHWEPYRERVDSWIETYFNQTFQPQRHPPVLMAA